MADEAHDDQGDPNPVSAELWHERLKEYVRLIEDKWQMQRQNLDRLYSRDERSDQADREYSIFWSNIEVLRGSVYARPPVPVVAPRFKQPNKVASTASETLERCLVTSYEQADCDGCMQEVRDEYLRYGRGTAWARLDTEGEPGTPEYRETVEYDHVTACDFAHDPARTWREVKWVARRSWLEREKGRERFDESLAEYDKTFDDVPVKKKDENATVERQDEQVPVWEIWSKDDNLVIWINEETDCPLDVQKPWLDLSSFWPCPKPAFGTVVPGKLAPVPDIRQYSDQIEEINEYTARIAALSESLRVRGFYPAGLGEVSEAIEAAIQSTDNKRILVPISSFAAFGGVSPKDSIIWLPIDQIAEVVKGLVELRRVLIDDVYQITGISDILRGETESDETATAQQIKSQWGSIRIRPRQNELVRFARDMTRIAGEIVSENFQPETVAEMSQMGLPSQEEKMQAQATMAAAQQAQQMGQPPPPPPPPGLKEMLDKPSLEEVMEFLRDDKARGFTIEIETDSTIEPDENAEKQRRVEFVTAIGGLIREAVPLVMQAPPLGPFIGEVLKFTAQGFRAGRPLESAIDQLVEQMKAATQQPQQQQPDPRLEAEKVKAEAAIKKTQLDGQRDQQKHGLEMQRLNAEGQMDQQELDQDWQRLEMDRQRNLMDQQRMANQAAMPPRRM